MKSWLTELRKRGFLELANGGKLTRADNRTAIYEASQKVRVELPLDEKTAEIATADRPMLAVFQSLLGIDYADLAKRVANLTAREMQVFEQVGMGRKGQAVAEEFGISPKTLDIHRANVGRKLGVRTSSQFGRLYTAFRVCNHFNPEVLEQCLAQKAAEW